MVSVSEREVRKVCDEREGRSDSTRVMSHTRWSDKEQKIKKKGKRILYVFICPLTLIRMHKCVWMAFNEVYVYIMCMNYKADTLVT